MRIDLDPPVLHLLAIARLRAMSTAPYLSRLLATMTWVAAPGIGTVAIDERLRVYLDPPVVVGWGPDLTAGALIHEAHHVLRSHHDRARSAGVETSIQLVWNIAADLEINDDLTDGNVQLPDGCVMPVAFGYADGLPAETYFARLMASGKWARQSVQCGSGADGVRRAWDLAGDDPTVPGIDAVEVEMHRESAAEAIRGLPPGDVPAGLRRWAEARAERQIDWRSLLRRHARRRLAQAAGKADYTYARPHRRTTWVDGPILPGLYAPPTSAAVIVDTSGSIGADLLSLYVAEIGHLLAELHNGELTVVTCDATATISRRVRRLDSVELVGGGGTDLRNAFDLLRMEARTPSLIIALTDGETPWPERPPRAPTVILTSSAPGPSWATTIYLDGFEDSPTDW